jgi:hypothetical protein
MWAVQSNIFSQCAEPDHSILMFAQHNRAELMGQKNEHLEQVG